MASKTTRPLTNSLRVLIAAGSVGAFFGGWVLLAHSPNPYEKTASAAPLDAPAPAAQDDGLQNQLQPLPTPRARTAPTLRQLAPNSQTSPQFAPNSQTSPNLQPQFGTQTRRRSRMRTGGS
jgi:hypothetical protein